MKIYNEQLNNKNRLKHLNKTVVSITILLLSLLVFFFQFDHINKFLIKDKLQKSIIKVQQSFAQMNLQIKGSDTFKQQVQYFLKGYHHNLHPQGIPIFQIIFMQTQTTKRNKSAIKKYQSQLQPFFKFFKNIYKQELELILKDGHVSQLDQNVRQKFENYINNGQEDYLAQIFEHLQNLNFGYECQFMSYDCISTKIFVFESLFVSTKQDESYHMCRDDYLVVLKIDNSQSKLSNQLQVIDVIRIQANQQNQRHKLNRSKNKISLHFLQQIILDELQMSPLFQLCSKQHTFDTVTTQKPFLNCLNQLGIYINHYQQLTSLSQLLNYLNKTVSSSETLTIQNMLSFLSEMFLYQLHDQQYQLLDSKLDQIIMKLTTYQFNNSQDKFQNVNKDEINIKSLNSQLKQLVSNIRQSNLSSFPSDYKLGIFLPLVVVIVYPTVYCLKKTFFAKFF